jgi:hypothetical protein
MEDCHHDIEEPWLSWQVNKGRSIFAYMPREPHHAVLSGDEMLFKSGLFASGRGPVFAGAMFEEVCATIELSPSIAWLLEAIEGWQPKIYGRAIGQIMTGQINCDVNAWVERGAGDALAKTLVERFGNGIDITNPPDPIDGGLGFIFAGTAYSLREVDVPEPQRFLSGPTVDRFYLLPDRRVRATRISWLDLAARHTRSLSAWELDYATSKYLEMDGFRVLPSCKFREPANHLDQNAASTSSH